ncbi:uncharacterized protein LOC100573101 [Acyrthosiphon pisum]|uniref:Uncharacterized protein n=1 Tax=Acyrthosiphon pisum TaxID=7029 RepID=A0A8R1W9K1_ACYPI|nr:uncharacterized protein LOC100573101 [Acyrthosiphon pisum]|eukprot:XP_003244235.1 PREDICTED: uncharacterized protein LOC100573101 [Acyrthosiphon pisum]
MNKLLSIVVLLAVAVCSCHCISDRRSIRSATPVISANIDPITVDATAPRDSAAAETIDIYNTARGKKGGNKHKMEMMHMGLSYVKMMLSTLMAAIGHVFAFKSVGLSLISVLIQIAQFIMVLKKNRESQPPSYKIVETPWHTSPTESYGVYGSYAGHGKASAAVNYSPYAAPQVRRRR